MEFEEILQLSRKIDEKFKRIEDRSWTIEVITMELSKQVGDLCKVILTHEGYYLFDRKDRENYRAEKNNIGNELADILHQIIRISDYYGIDLLQAHIDARKGEEKYIDTVVDSL